jgi:PD-(D/E)XK endonuclease
MDECKQFRTLKERGEYVELRFMVQAMLHGFQVSRPWGDSSSYDIGLESGSRILRVQVKSTAYRTGTGYLCQFAARKKYSVDKIEFFAAYVIPEDVWYLIPSPDSARSVRPTACNDLSHGAMPETLLQIRMLPGGVGATAWGLNLRMRVPQPFFFFAKAASFNGAHRSRSGLQLDTTANWPLSDQRVKSRRFNSNSGRTSLKG